MSTPWWKTRPLAYAGWEMVIMRGAFAVLVFLTIDWSIAGYQEQPHPNGIAHFIDLSALAANPPGALARGLTIAGLVGYTAGFLPALTLLPALLFSLAIGTLANSQGAINHSTQLVSMILLGQTLAYAWSLREKPRLFPTQSVHRLSVYVSLVVIAASYVVSAAVKWTESDGTWIWRTPHLAVQLLKTNYNDYYNTLVAPPAWLQQFTEFMVENPWFTRVFFGTGLLIESLAFVVLINRRWAFIGGLAIVALHVGISKVMSLEFETHIAVAVIFLLNLPGAAAAVARWLRLTRPPGVLEPLT